MSLQDYRNFIASRALAASRDGFSPRPINSFAKTHQTAVLGFALA